MATDFPAGWYPAPATATAMELFASDSYHGSRLLYDDWVQVYYKGHLVERMGQVRGEGETNVNYPTGGQPRMSP